MKNIFPFFSKYFGLASAGSVAEGRKQDHESDLEYRGFSIPAELIRLTGGEPETFDLHALGQISTLRHTLGLLPFHNVLEIGCGVGRSAIPLSEFITDGSYLGIDIIHAPIKWAKENISTRNPRFRFEHFDVRDDFLNLKGSMSTKDVTIPVQDQSIDLVIMWSVFTHLYRDEIIHYLNECRRVIKPGGRLWATWFNINADVLKSIQKHPRTNYALTFNNPPDEQGCFLQYTQIPRGAIGYSTEAMTEMIHNARFKLARPYLKGGWSGAYEDAECGQDAMILVPD